MDYKELIKLSKKAAAEWQGTHEYYQAATLITALCEATETLLVEREAAVADLTSSCGDSGDACHLCKYQPCAQKYGRCIGWEWRGPTPPDREQPES